MWPITRTIRAESASRLARASWIEIVYTFHASNQSRHVEARESLVDRNGNAAIEKVTKGVEARESLVDRNLSHPKHLKYVPVEARESLVDRNRSFRLWLLRCLRSRLARASWIEIVAPTATVGQVLSRLARASWIEIALYSFLRCSQKIVEARESLVDRNQLRHFRQRRHQGSRLARASWIEIRH